MSTLTPAPAGTAGALLPRESTSPKRAGPSTTVDAVLVSPRRPAEVGP
jgi:hypothetical protein